MICFKIPINTAHYCSGMNSMYSCFVAKKTSGEEKLLQNSRQ